jgi:hypothetical protein
MTKMRVKYGGVIRTHERVGHRNIQHTVRYTTINHGTVREALAVTDETA